MSVTIQCEDGEPFPLTAAEVVALWEAVRRERGYQDAGVVVRCATPARIRALNKQYRSDDAPTNVLTFSYEARPEFPDIDVQHEVVVCVAVAVDEAQVRGAALHDYVALLLVHAFLHATGLDHEQSAAAADEMHRAERLLLRRCGFTTDSL